MPFRSKIRNGVASSATCTIDAPANLAEGDQLTLIIASNATSATMQTPPSGGWTLASPGGEVAATDFRCWLYTKTAEAGDVGASPMTSWTLSAAATQSALAIADEDEAFDEFASNESAAATSGPHASPSITPSDDGAIVRTAWLIDRSSTETITPDDPALQDPPALIEQAYADSFAITVVEQTQATAAAVTEDASATSSQDWASFAWSLLGVAAPPGAPGEYGYGTYGAGDYGPNFGSGAATVSQRLRQPHTVRVAITGRARQPHAARTSVTAALREPHAVRAAVTAALRQPAGVRANRTGQLRQPAGIRAALTGALRQPAAVRATVSQRLRQPHAARAGITGRLQQPHAVAAAVTTRLRQPAGVRTTIAGAARQPFTARTPVSQPNRQPHKL
ncbi:MAG TPA: hypothetical protein VN213_13665, partial [Solirubrobacteraceae bacterium]|nr:hypothetical protein [Solirubrobacteraceae bacterium]